MASIIDKFMNPPTKSTILTTQQPKRSETEKMQATEWHGKMDVRVVERPKPLVTEPKDALIRVTTTTICGSDLHLYHDKTPGVNSMQKGDVLGHEFMGIIEDVGSEVTNLKIGQRVVVSAVIACGQCYYCQNQMFSCCDTTNPSGQMEREYGHRTAGLFGYSHLTGGYDGGQAEYVRVPFAEMNCLPVPENLKDEQVLFLSDILCTGWHGNELGEVGEGDTVAVWGCGPVGLIAQMWAKFRGAKRVIGIDLVDYRLQKARELGSETIDCGKETVVTRLQEMVPGGPDVSIDCAGFRFPTSFMHKFQQALKIETDALDIVDQMIKVTRKGGRIALIGDYFAYGNQFPIGAFMEKSLTMRGGQVYVQKYWKKLLEFIQQGKVDPTIFVTHTWPLKKASEAYQMFDSCQDNVIKVLLKPDLEGNMKS